MDSNLPKPVHVKQYLLVWAWTRAYCLIQSGRLVTTWYWLETRLTVLFLTVTGLNWAVSHHPVQWFKRDLSMGIQPSFPSFLTISHSLSQSFSIVTYKISPNLSSKLAQILKGRLRFSKGVSISIRRWLNHDIFETLSNSFLPASCL